MIASAAVLGLAAGGLALLLGANAAPKRQLASGCGLINCGASLPSPAVTKSTQSRAGKAHHRVSHAPASPSPSLPPSQAAASAPPAATSAAPARTSAAPARTNVTMSFVPGQDQRDFGHFQDQMTLVNQGGSPVSGWSVQLVLPGDGVDSVESQGGWNGVPFEHWQFSGDTLTITADTGNETLGPGTPLNLSIHGQGSATSPAGCTFNGAACAISTSEQQFSQDQPAGQPDQLGGQPSQPAQRQEFQGQPDQQVWRQYSQQSWGGQTYGGQRR